MGNLKEYLSFEKILCCGGSWMVKEDMIKKGNFEEIEKNPDTANNTTKIKICTQMGRLST